MKTVSGVLYINKTEEKNIRTLLDHAKRDISFGGGGTYWNGKYDADGDCIADRSAVRRSEDAIENIEWILEACTNPSRV
jgi:hypothetical protein